MRLQAGKLRHKIQVQRNAGEGSYGSHGEITDNWTKDFEAWASIETLSGRELELARQNFATATHRITMRYDSRLDNTRHRIAHAGRTFHIEHADNVDQRNIAWVLTCGEELGEAP